MAAEVKMVSAIVMFWFIVCQTPQQTSAVCSYGSVRLVNENGTVNHDGEGRLEICIDNVWGTVCDDGFTNTNAQVVCRQLGISTHSNYIGALARSSIYYGSGNGSIWLDDVSCTGTESTLLQCSHRSIGSHDCVHSEDVGVLCLGWVITSGTILLSRYNVSSNSYYYGTVRVWSNGWGNICDDSYYSYNEANVICHQLGYTGVSTYSRAGLTSYGTDYLSMKWDDVDCSSSNYLSIAQCTYSTFIDIGCINSNSYDATVYCYSTRIWNSNPFPGMVRLQGGAYSTQGRVEVYCNGQWGTICNNGFDSTDANTICKQLGYDGASYYNHLALSGSSSQSIWSTNMISSSSDTCFGTRNTCPTTSISSCTHARDATVSCGDSSSSVRQTVTSATCDPNACTTNGSLRLVNGSSNSGRLEICINNRWGTICDDFFSSADAQVACRQLGFSSTGATYRLSAYYGQGNGTIWLDNVGCTGSESILLQCSHNGIGSHNCDHSEDVSVICSSTSSVAAAVGGVVGTIVFIVVVIVCCVCCVCCIYQANSKPATRVQYTGQSVGTAQTVSAVTVTTKVTEEQPPEPYLPQPPAAYPAQGYTGPYPAPVPPQPYQEPVYPYPPPPQEMHPGYLQQEAYPPPPQYPYPPATDGAPPSYTWQAELPLVSPYEQY